MPGFATTHWSLIVAAKDDDALQARAALGELCRVYWYPIYVFVRRQGFDSEQAQDLTQEFFTRFLERDFLAAVDRNQGRFRSFLLVCCKHFLANERDRQRAQKRGGDRHHVPIDTTLAESRYGMELAHSQTADKLFERRWVCALLEQVLSRLRREFEDAGKAQHFELLKGFLTGGSGGASQAEVAQELHMNVGAVKVAAHRLRRRYRELLREEIGRTVGDPAQVEDEIRDLFAALST
jgi:RNA polymerase sigma-70 factor (ECF subfamily)